MTDDSTREQHLVEEDELFGESEDDLRNLAESSSFDAMIVATDWTTETLLSQITRGSVELDPVFQRRDAWDRRKKSRFIESLIVGLPVPQVVLAERRGRRGEYLVLDGKQRLLGIQQFYDQTYRLSGLELRHELNGLTIDSLPFEDRQALDTQTIRTIVVRNWKREEFLYLVFLRLNTSSVPLSPQELRQALHPGPFVQHVNEYTANHLEFAGLLRESGHPDFRMRDVELLVRFFAFTRFLPEYRGNLKELLDFTCENLNREMVTSPERVIAESDECTGAIHAVIETFGNHAFRRWNRDDRDYERRFNRAVFDAMTFYARDPVVGRLMVAEALRVRGAFEDLCLNASFQAAITATTKTPEAIFVRISMWGDALSKTIRMPLPIPVRDSDDSIVYT